GTMTTWRRVRTEIAIASSRMRRDASSSRNSRHARRYFLSAAFFSAGALDADFAIDDVGTMMCAYGVPFHITHGPPLVQSVGYASSWLASVGRIMMCGPVTTHWLSAARFVAYGSVLLAPLSPLSM